MKQVCYKKGSTTVEVNQKWPKSNKYFLFWQLYFNCTFLPLAKSTSLNDVHAKSK